jgi:hypothetical protein
MTEAPVTVRITQEDITLLHKIFVEAEIREIPHKEFLIMKKTFIPKILTTFSEQLGHLKFTQVFDQAKTFRSRMIYRKTIGMYCIQAMMVCIVLLLYICTGISDSFIYK